jgi:hypothetical protein
MGWYKRWLQKVYGELTFRKRADGNYDFVNGGLFVWPYIVTDEQRKLIERKVIRPSDWMPRIALLVLIAAMIAVGSLRPAGFRDLLGFFILTGGSVFILASTVWPLVWAKMRLQDAPRHSKPFYWPPPLTPIIDLSAMLCRAPALCLWAGMLICFGASGIAAVLAARDLTRGALEQGWVEAGGSLFFATPGLICLLRWWGRPKDWASLNPDGTIDLRIIKIGRPKPQPPGSDGSA